MLLEEPAPSHPPAVERRPPSGGHHEQAGEFGAQMPLDRHLEVRSVAHASPSAAGTHKASSPKRRRKAGDGVQGARARDYDDDGD
jgi:hypothetical protein